MGRGDVGVHVIARPLSERARAQGLETLDDLKVAVLRQQPTWWQGRSFHCPSCGIDFDAPGSAAEHTVRHQHPVLRMD